MAEKGALSNSPRSSLASLSPPASISRPASIASTGILDEDEPPPYWAIASDSFRAWTAQDPRTSSSQSLTPHNSTEGTKRSLLLVYIHGYFGNETSFQSFPAHVHNLVSILLADSHVVHTKIYPRYRTKHAVEVAAGDFSNWISHHELPDRDIVLVGHSMGGLVAAEVAMLPRLVGRGSDPLRHRFLGTINLDAPFLGMNPRVIKSGLASIFSRSQSRSSSSPSHGPISPSSSMSSLFSVSSDQNYNPTFSNDVQLPSRSKLGSFAHFLGKHRYNLKEAAKAAAQSHYQFPASLMDQQSLKIRYCRIRALEETDERQRGVVMHGAANIPRIRFVNFYTVSNGRIPKSVQKAAKVSDKEKNLELDVSHKSRENSPFAIKRTRRGSENSTISSSFSSSSSSLSASSSSSMSDFSSSFSSSGLANHRESRGLRTTQDPVGLVSKSNTPLDFADPIHIQSTATPSDAQDSLTRPSAPQPPKPPRAVLSYETRGDYQDAVHVYERESREYLLKLREYHRELRRYYKDLARKRQMKRRERNLHRVGTGPESRSTVIEARHLGPGATHTDHDTASRERKIERKLERAQSKQTRRESHAAHKEVRRESKQARKEDKQARKATRRDWKLERKTIREAQKAREKEIKAQGKGKDKGRSLDDPIAQSVSDSSGLKAASKNMPTLNTSRKAVEEENNEATTLPPGGKKNLDERPKKELKFCVLPPKDTEGAHDPCWRRVQMGDMDEVTAHCSLFQARSPTETELEAAQSSEFSERYTRLVGDTAEIIEAWVHEDMSERLSRGIEAL